MKTYEIDSRINQALIDAAPYLLEALTNLYVVAKDQLNLSANYDGLQNCDWLAHAQAAITKATQPYEQKLFYYFAIANKDNPELLWSNTSGWVDHEDFDLFTLEESETLDLPIGGEWTTFNNIIRNH
jgi:hypothetical protein